MKALDSNQLRTVLGPVADVGSSFDSEQIDRFLASLQLRARRCVRPRPSIPSVALPPGELPFETEAVPWSTAGRFLCASSIRPGGWMHYAAGDYTIQDAGSLLPVTLLELQPGQMVCDLCAAPGGKSTAILEGLAGTGLLLSNEVISSRVGTLQLALARTGLANYFLTNLPVDRLVDALNTSDPEVFDRVLVDAPCTGQSMLSRGKQTVSAFAEKQIRHSAGRQQSILRSAISLVKPGGRLVYSTCTFSFEENEAVMVWLREQVPDWLPLELNSLQAWKSPGFPGCYRLWPHRDQCNGGFAAALIRPTNVASLQVVQQQFSGNGMGARNDATSAPNRLRSTSRLMDHWSQWPEKDNDTFWHSHPDQVTIWASNFSAHWFHPRVSPEWRELAHGGLQVAERFGDHWQPAYPLATLAQRLDIFPEASVIELTDSDAIQFMSGASLHRNGMVIGSSNWHPVAWRGRPLGWAKQVGSQLKNHLPKPLRQTNISINPSS